jgi:hypothetical protein
MPAIRDRDETRARDGALVDLAAVEGRDRVVATPDEQCRRAHALQEVERPGERLTLMSDDPAHNAIAAAIRAITGLATRPSNYRFRLL